MQNSVSRLNETNSCPDNVRILRQKLRDDGVLGENSGVLTFTADHAFNSPSLAAAVVYGGSVNGRSAWVDADGKTINDIDKISLDQQEAIEAISEVANEPTCEESG